MDLAKELKKQKNIRLMMIPIVIGTVGTVTKGLQSGVDKQEIGVCVSVCVCEREREREFVWVLWHINLCWLFNAKSIFIQINSSTSNNSI